MFYDSFFFLHYGLNAWITMPKARLDITGSCLAQEEWRYPWTNKSCQLPRFFCCWTHYTSCKGKTTTGTATELAAVAKSRKGYICEVTAASEQRSQGWKQGQAVITALIPHFSLAVENWQSQIFPFSLPHGFAYAAAEQTWVCFVLLVPLRISSAVLGWTLRKHIHFNECLLFYCE